MALLFTAEKLFSLLEDYNAAVWPAPVLLLALALGAVALLFVHAQWRDAALSATLALLWLWSGLAFHLAYFAQLSLVGFGGALLFLAGAEVFAWQGVKQRALRFEAGLDLPTALAGVVVLFALVVHPLWASAAGHEYPELPTFGTPGTVTLFTLGLLLLARGPGARAACVVPVLWALVQGLAAVHLDMLPDLGLLAAATLVGTLLVRPPHTSSRPPPIGTLRHA